MTDRPGRDGGSGTPRAPGASGASGAAGPPGSRPDGDSVGRAAGTVLTVLGTGTGDTAPPAAEALATATLVAGARRHLDAAAGRVPAGAVRLELGPLSPALETIAAHLAEAGAAPHAARRVVVLASGDPGFFGIVRALADRFGPEALTVAPSAPSVAVAFSRAGLPWDDAAVVSAHGRDRRTAVNVCRAHPKTAVLTGPGAGPAELGADLVRAGTARTLVVAAALGTPAERLERLTPAQAAQRDWPEPVSVVLCLDEARALAAGRRAIAGPARPAGGWALPEEEFGHRDSMITKAEVRALALARLGPGLGDLVWDVGSGCGSVAVECARLGAAAVAVEQAADAVARIRANAAAHGTDVQVEHGTAPAALEGLPEPDAVFVGGGGRSLPAVVAACARRARRAVVVTLAALDRVPDVRAALAAEGFATDGVLLQSSRLAPLPGDVVRLAATNPVFVLWGTRPSPPPGPGPGEDARGSPGVPPGPVPAPSGPDPVPTSPKEPLP